MHKKASEFYEKIIQTYDFTGDEAILLNATIESLSIFYKATDLLNSEGLLLIEQGKMPRKNPAAEIAKNSYNQFLAGCRHLGICRPEPEKKRGYGIL